MVYKYRIDVVWDKCEDILELFEGGYMYLLVIVDIFLKIEYEVYIKLVIDKLYSIKNEGFCNDLFCVMVNIISVL